MKGCRKPGFTLVELLVVIVILSLLVALLVPAISAVWNQSLMTKCRMNLGTLFKAQSVWRADNKAGQFATGPGWPTAILPYLEGQSSALRCPARTQGGFGEEGSPVSGLTLDDIVVKVFGGGGQPFYYEVSMTASSTPPFPIWKVTKQGNNREEYWFNDFGYGQQGLDWDWAMLVTFTGSVPTYIEFIQPPGIGGHAWWHSIYVCGKFALELRGGDNGAGKTIDLRKYDKYAAHPTDYAVSRGFYEVADRNINYPDGKLFFMLDYAKSVADYQEPVGGDDWTLNLAEEPPAEWDPPRIYKGLSWDAVTALRHFRMANVLFGDGHIESLGLNPNTSEALCDGKYLRPDSPLWRYSGP